MPTLPGQPPSAGASGGLRIRAALPAGDRRCRVERPPLRDASRVALEWHATIRSFHEGGAARGARFMRALWRARRAVEKVSSILSAGETLGLVGESGSGKSTLARAILRLIPAARGSVVWRGTDLLSCDAPTLRRTAPRSANRVPGSAGEPESAHDHR